MLLYIGLVLLLIAAHARGENVLVVGATGTTGLRAVQGLLDVGFKPGDLHLMTRDANNERMKKMKDLGFGVVEANLEDSSSIIRAVRQKKFVGCYIHSTSSDTIELDTLEVARARNLCKELDGKVSRVVYNSAAGDPGHGVKRIRKKQQVEEVFSETKNPSSEFTALRANIFMEELWKDYTRPSILNGKYPLPTNRWRKVYLVSVRDLGRLAGTMIRDGSGEKFRVFNIAGDCLAGPSLAKLFQEAQNSPCHHCHDRKLTRYARNNFPELYEQIMFLQTSTASTDIGRLREEFPNLISSFEQFLAETNWGDRQKTFADFADPDTLEIF